MTTTNPEQAAYSVGELLANRMCEDRWRLALVQRDEVWGVDRMGNLLDSLLAGYPIGALLLCRTDRRSQVVDRVGGSSQVTDAAPNQWQLLDGQQRINALYSMLTASDPAHARYGRFFLDITTERSARTAALEGERALSHIIWREGEGGRQQQGPYDDFPLRPRCIDLSRIYDARGLLRELGHDDHPAELARRIDPLFTHPISKTEEESARHWLTRLSIIWAKAVVPVMYAQVEEPVDVLELFTRVNRGGIVFNEAEIYFAAVKTFWPQAEPRLAAVVAAGTVDGPGRPLPLLTMGQALRLVSRLGSRGIGRGEVMPLRVARLSGSSREPLVAAMEALTAEGSPFLRRLDEFAAAFAARTELGFAAQLVNHHLWDEVIGWAVTAEEWTDDDFRAIDSYLLGGTLFAYPTTFRTSFSRLALTAALAAGATGKAFPLARIIGRVKGSHRDLRLGRAQVRLADPASEDGAQDRRALGEAHSSLLLALAQRIPHGHPEPLDIDHLYASALASSMRVGRSHHRDRHRINSLGNKWLLGASANRTLQHTPPREKFDKLLRWLAEPGGAPSVWGRDGWTVTDEEIGLLCSAHHHLDRKRVEEGMAAFVAFVVGRGERIVQDTFDRFSDAQRFARDDTTVEPVFPEEAAEEWESATSAVTERLGLAKVAARFPAVHRREGLPDEAATGELAATLGPWAQRAGELEWEVKEATRVVAYEAGATRAAPLRHGYERSRGFHYLRWVLLGAPGKTYLGVGVPASSDRAERSPVWALLSTDTDGYQPARNLLQASPLGPLDEDDRGVWIPLPVSWELQGAGIRIAIEDHLRDIRRVLKESGVA